MPALNLLLSSVVVCLDFGIAFSVLKTNPKRTVNRVFFMFACGMGLLGLGMILLIGTRHFFFDKLVFLGGYLTIAGLVLLAKTFPEGRVIGKGFWPVFIPLLGLLLATPFNLIIQGMNVRPDGAIEPINGPLIRYFVLIIGGYVLLGLWLFVKSYRNLSGKPKLQIQYLAFGALIFSSALFVFNVVLPAQGIPDFTLLGPNASIVFTLFAAYAIVRHQLLDIRLVIQKGAIYLALVALITGFYLAAVFLGGYIAGRELNVYLVSAGVTTLVGIFGVPYIERFFRKITDRFFFKEKYDYSEALQALSETLHRTLDQQEIIRESARNLKSILRAQAVRFALAEGKPEAAPDDDAKLEIPIELDGAFIGTIFLGQKLSGDPYSEEDRTLLTTFSYQVAIALERSKLYERVKQYSIGLEDKVRERTEELQALQEEQKQMMIEISHNLQTPLTVVKGELGFLKEQLPGNPHLSAFEKSIDGISKFIYDLLKLAKLEMSREEAVRDPLDLSETLHELMEYFGVVAREKNIDLSSSIEPGIRVLISKNKFEDLVTNLLSNAMKYMSDGRQKKVTVTLGHGAELGIADTGIGIRSEDMSRIFHRFYRVSDSKASHIKGTGLGLAICKRIVEKAGGTIEAESVFGKGTKFKIRLPEYKEANPFPEDR